MLLAGFYLFRHAAQVSNVRASDHVQRPSETLPHSLFNTTWWCSTCTVCLQSMHCDGHMLMAGYVFATLLCRTAEQMHPLHSMQKMVQRMCVSTEQTNCGSTSDTDAKPRL